MKKLFLLAVVPAAAWAGFGMVNPGYKPMSPAERAAQSYMQTAAPTPTPSSNLFHLVYMGQPTGGIEIRKGGVQNVRFIDAIKQIAPEGWHAYLKPELVGRFDKNRQVGWVGERSWVEVLDTFAGGLALEITVDWSKKLLWIGRPAGVQDMPMAVAESLTEPVKPTPKPTTPPAPEEIRHIGPRDGTVRNALDRWCKEAGWQLDWVAVDTDGKIVDYPLEYTATIRGPLLDAVKAILQGYLKADYPLDSDVWPENRMIRITNLGAK